MAAVTVSTPVAYAKLAVITATHLVNDGALVARTAILPTIRDEFALGNAEIGLISSATTLAAGLFQMPASFAADHTGRKKTLLSAGLVLVALTFVAWGWSPNYLSLLIVSLLLGIAGAGYHPTSMAIVTEQFDPRRKTFFLAVHNLGANAGAALMPAALGGLALLVGWRLASQYLAVPIFLVALLTYLVFSEYRGHGSSVGRSLRGIKGDVLFNRPLLLLAIVSTLNMGAYAGMMPFLPLYLADTFGWDTGTLGLALGTLNSTGIFSQPVVGYLADRHGRSKLMLTVLFLSAILTLVVPFVRDATLAFALLAVLGLPLFCFRPLLYSMATDIVGPSSTSSAVGLIFTLNQFFSTLTPLAGGAVADRVGLSGAIFLYGMIFLLACVPAVVILRPGSGIATATTRQL